MTTERRPDDTEVSVVGIGADGWAGLAPSARAVLGRARVVIGARRQLGLLPALGADLVPWPSPLLPALPALLEEHSGSGLVVLASGDPMFFGIGRAVTELLGAGRVTVLPHPSSASLACARLGWPLEEVPVVSLVGRPLSSARPDVHDGRRLLLLCADRTTPAAVADALTAWGFGASRLRGARAARLCCRAPGGRYGGSVGPPARRRPQRARGRVRGRRHRQPAGADPRSGGHGVRARRPAHQARGAGDQPGRPGARSPASCSGTSAAEPGSIGIEWLRVQPQLQRRLRRVRPDRAAGPSRPTRAGSACPGLRGGHRPCSRRARRPADSRRRVRRRRA